MNSNLIIKGDDSQEATIQFRDRDPKTPAIALLALLAKRFFDGANAPLFAEVGPFPQHFLLEICGESVSRHA